MDTSVPLNAEQIEVCWRMYQHETCVRACVNRILSSLFSAGILLNDGTGNKFKADFDTHLSRFWIPFAANTVRNFILYGLSPWVINKTKDPKTRRVVKYPTAVPMSHIQIHTYVDGNYEQQFKVFQRQHQFSPISLTKEDNRVHLSFYEMCNTPDPSGALHSNMSTLVKSLQDMDEFQVSVFVACFFCCVAAN